MRGSNKLVAFCQSVRAAGRLSITQLRQAKLGAGCPLLAVWGNGWLLQDRVTAEIGGCCQDTQKWNPAEGQWTGEGSVTASQQELPPLPCLLYSSSFRSHFRVSSLNLDQPRPGTSATSSRASSMSFCIPLWDDLDNVYLSMRERII